MISDEFQTQSQNSQNFKPGIYYFQFITKNLYPNIMLLMFEYMKLVKKKNTRIIQTLHGFILSVYALEYPA